MAPGMDDVRLGQLLRAARIRRGWRQVDVAARAGVGRTVISDVERGQLGTISIRSLRKIAAALEVRLDLVARWRGGDGERLVSARHSALTELEARRLIGLGWLVRPEVSFSIYGERGVIDLLAWHPELRALLVIEIKSEIVDIGELLGTLDRKRRLAATIAAEFRWSPASVSVWVLVAESRTNRRRVAQHVVALRAALPGDGRALRSWLRHPSRPHSGLAFVPFVAVGGTRTGMGGPKRVRRRRLPRADATQA